MRERGRRRARLVAGILCVLICASGARGIQLAADPDESTLGIATDKRWASVSIQGPRGEIRDSDGAVLAMSVATPAVFVDPVTMEERGVDIDATATKVAGILGMAVEPIKAAMTGQGRYVRIARGVHPSVAEELRQLGLTSKGLIVEENYRRYYPEGNFSGQVIGYVDEAGKGVQGVEAWFDEQLTGARLVAQHRVNRVGRVLELASRDARDVQGMTIYLTIDREVQHLTERALQGVMERHQPMWAAAVVMEVRTGRVLAMATVPGFDPNNPGTDGFDVMRNRTVMDPVEPGSVFKPFTYAAALEEGLTRPDEIMTTVSPYHIAGATIRDDHPHNHLTAAEVIKFSSNIGAAQFGARLGANRLLSYLQLFGFGEISGVQTSHEEAGRRSPPRVGPVELATISYGQGITATLLQLASATAAIANGGVRMHPILVDRVEDPWGELRQGFEPTPAARAVSSETARMVAEAMARVTDDDSTAPRARIPGYAVAGKTGTSYKVKEGRYSSTARYSSFIGFSPVDQPELAMAILVDEPTVGSRYGGIVAAPAYPEVIGPALKARGVAPDLTAAPPSTAPDAEPVSAPAEAVVLAWQDGGWLMPDLIGRDLRGAIASLQGAGLALQIDGSGFLVAQVPAPGSLVLPGDRVALHFN